MVGGMDDPLVHLAFRVLTGIHGVTYLGRQRMAMLLQLFGLVLRVAMSLASIFASTHLSELFALSSAVFYGIYLVTIVFILKRAQSE